MEGGRWQTEVFTPPLDLTSLRRFVVAHAVPGVERHDANGICTRAVPAPHGIAIVQVDLAEPRGNALAIRLRAADPTDVPVLRRRVRDWLGLEVDPAPADAALGRDPGLADDVAARPGLRVPGAVDPVEAALFTVLGQQVSMAAARTFAGRLVAAYGHAAGHDSALSAFPAAGVIAAVAPLQLQRTMGVTGARARAIHALAAALAEGPQLRRTDDPVERAAVRERLLALPGIGPWTADLIAVRVLGDPDVFLPGDLVARRAMGAADPRAAASASLGWRPYRSHALLHLWTRAVFSDAAGSAARAGRIGR